MFAFVRNHKAGVAVGAVAAIGALAWVAFGFFGVHTLFVDDVVDEAGPVFDAEPAAVVESAEPAATPSAAASVDESAVTDDRDSAPVEQAATDDAVQDADDGTDVEVDATTEDADVAADEAPTPATTAPPTPQVVTEFTGTFVSEDHPTSGVATVLGNGTGQRFLRFENFETDNGPDLNVYLFDDETGDFVDLGDLKGNIGDQNYEIPEDVDLSRFDRVSVWCVRFGVGFGSAELMTP